MEEDLRQEKPPGERVLLERTVKGRAQITLKGVVRIRRVIVGILPFAKITNLNRDANSATNVCLDIEGQPSKKSKKSGGKDQLLY